MQSATILEVKDIKASEAFYRDQFGFRPGDGHIIGIGQNEMSAAGMLTLPYA